MFMDDTTCQEIFEISLGKLQEDTLERERHGISEHDVN